MYLYVGAPDAWADDDYPPAPEDSINAKRDVWNSMVGLSRINYNDTRLGIDRNDWTSGVVYNKYDHTQTNETLASGNGFFILAGTTDRDVYKCLDNNGDIPSSAKPTNKNLKVKKEVDGYIWKYMYTIPDADFTMFATSTIIPTKTESAVVSSAVDGAVLNIPLAANSSSGTGRYYRGSGYSTGTIGAGITNGTIFTAVGSTATNVLVLDATDTTTFGADDFYNNSAIYVSSSGQSFGTLRTIVDWVTSTNTVTLDSTVTNINSGDSFIIGPKVTISDGGGSGFVGIGEVNGYGNLVNIIVSSSGAGYANSIMTATVNNVYSGVNGADADVSAYISTLGGHGRNADSELEAKYLIISGETTIASSTDSETGVFVGLTNKYRQVGILRNPETQGVITTTPTYDLRTNLYFAHPTPSLGQLGRIEENALLTNANTGGTAKVWSVNGDSGKQYVSVFNVRGNFSEGDVVYAGDQYVAISSADLSSHEYPSKSQQTPNEAVQRGMITKYSGDIIYLENISQISRTVGQRENFKFVFEF